MIRVGIDLSRAACTVVELEVPRSLTGRRSAVSTPIRSVHVLPFGSEQPHELAAALRQLRIARRLPRHGWAGVWGLSQLSGLVHVPAGVRHADELARRDARSALLVRAGEAPAVSIAAASKRDRGAAREARVVPFVAVSRDELRARVEPLRAAGFALDGVVTPAAALVSLARVTAPIVDGVTYAYVALGPAAVAMAIVRDGVLQFARELPWGYERAAENGNVDRGTVAERLSGELKRTFVLVKQRNRQDVAQVFVCGDFPELRSLTAQLIQALDLEIETLDSLAGIDAQIGVGGQYREDMAGLRLAWAIATDVDPQFNLVSALRPSLFDSKPVAVAAAAAVLVGALLLWNYVAPFGSPPLTPPASRRPPPPPVASVTRSTPPPVAAPRPTTTITTTTTITSAPATTTTLPRIVTSSVASTSIQPVTSVPRAAAPPPPPSTTSAVARTSVPPVTSAPRTTSIAPRTEPAPQPRTTSVAPVQRATVVAPRLGAASAAKPGRQSEAPPPIETADSPRVRTILIAADRRIANVDGHVVSIGDRLGSAQVIDITADSVIVQEPSGRRVRLVLPRAGSGRRD